VPHFTGLAAKHRDPQDERMGERLVRRLLAATVTAAVAAFMLAGCTFAKSHPTDTASADAAAAWQGNVQRVLSDPKGQGGAGGVGSGMVYEGTGIAPDGDYVIAVACSGTSLMQFHVSMVVSQTGADRPLGDASVIRGVMSKIPVHIDRSDVAHVGKDSMGDIALHATHARGDLWVAYIDRPEWINARS
jgi:hypothetical protein